MEISIKRFFAILRFALNGNYLYNKGKGVEVAYIVVIQSVARNLLFSPDRSDIYLVMLALPVKCIRG